ncbi:MAG: asparagine synthase-related protein [Planctomycetaceae bacterium]
MPKTLVIAERLHQGSLRAAWHQATQFCRASSQSVVNLLSEAFHELLPFSLRGDWRRIGRGGFSRWERMEESSIPPWIRPEFARRFHLADRARNIHSELNGTNCSELRRDSPLSRFRFHMLRSGHGNFSRWYEAAELGVLVSHPFFDPRLVKLTAELDDRHVVIPGQQKPLLTAAMGSRLPSAITQRSGKGHFGEVYFRGLTKHRNRLNELIRRAGANLEEVIDVDVLLKCLHAASLGFARDAIVTDRLNVTLAFLHWLESTFPTLCLAARNSMAHRESGKNRDVSRSI